MEAYCSRQGPHVARKFLTVIISTMFLHCFISVTSSDSVITQWKQTVRIDVTHTEYNFVQQISHSTTNLMSSQQTSASEETTSQLTTTVSQSTMTSPPSPDVHCCCRCCFPSTPTCTFCDGDSLTDASDCANKEPKTINPVDRSKPNFEPPAALQESKHPERLA